MALINFNKRLIKKVLNYLLIAFLIFIIVSPNGKAWVLRQFISVGLFKAEIKKDAVKDFPNNSSFSFTDSKGNINNTSMLQGKVVFINFWASWCPPCRAEMPSLNNLYQALKDDERFVFLFVSEDDDQLKATDYLKKNDFSIPVYYRNQVSPEMFSGTLPTTIVLDKQGNIVMKHTGLAGYDNDKFISQLKSLL